MLYWKIKLKKKIKNYEKIFERIMRVHPFIEFCKTKIKDVEVNIEDLLSRLGEDNELE
mgnify:CR=1 FL=1